MDFYRIFSIVCFCTAYDPQTHTHTWILDFHSIPTPPFFFPCSPGLFVLNNELFNKLHVLTPTFARSGGIVFPVMWHLILLSVSTIAVKTIVRLVCHVTRLRLRSKVAYRYHTELLVRHRTQKSNVK